MNAELRCRLRTRRLARAARERGGARRSARPRLATGITRVTRESREQEFHRRGHALQVLLERRCQRVEPVRRADEVLESLARRRVVDTDRDQRDAMIDGTFDLAL